MALKSRLPVPKPTSLPDDSPIDFDNLPDNVPIAHLNLWFKKRYTMSDSGLIGPNPQVLKCQKQLFRGKSTTSDPKSSKKSSVSASVPYSSVASGSKPTTKSVEN